MEIFLLGHQDTIKLALGLIVLMGVNIILGSINAIFDSVFDFDTFIRGLIKAVIIISCFCATYFVGYLNTNIMSLNVDQYSVNILDAIHIMILAAYYAYAKQVINKMTTIINAALSKDSENHEKDDLE